MAVGHSGSVLVDSGDAGQQVFSRRNPRVSGLVAATLALHGLSRPPPIMGGWLVGV
jgi:hypothetical protein